MQMLLPADVAAIIAQLDAAGFEAWAVGGCVRDTLLGTVPKDWDICTSASPEEMQQVFRGERVIETGLKHGTLTVLKHHVPYEITTFRKDGDYTDHRHPDSVTFVTDIREDLSRRDFTVNAMAYHPVKGLTDLFEGQEDLQRGIIRCVGEAEKRFDEDALRILRALRFASVLDFAIEEKTAAAVHAMKDSLRDVAAERIRVELAKLLCGKGVGRILRNYADVIMTILPELKPMYGFEQHNPHHLYDVWEHTARGVEQIAPQETLRLTMLLHDSGKPETYFTDEQGIGHFYGHQACSAKIAERALQSLRVDNATRDAVLTLVENHDIDLPAETKMIRRRLNRFGETQLRALIEVRMADRIATGTVSAEEAKANHDAYLAALDALLAQQPCFTLKQLAVTGKDLMQAGMKPGKAIGETLNHLLEEVMEERLPNEKEALLKAAGRM